MANAEARYKNHDGEDLELFLDIDLNSQKIYELRSKGKLVQKYAEELKKLESLVTGKSLSEIAALKRSDIHLSENSVSVASLTLWLLHKAIDNYLGSEAVLSEADDRLCVCFGITARDLNKQIQARSDYELKHVIAETFATSACGRCLPAIKKTMEDLRLASGLIAGLTHSKGRFDKDGNWIKIKGKYPADILIWLDDLKQKWMVRENIVDQFRIEFTNIEGLHLSVSVNAEADRAQKILQALSDYLKSETGVLFFLHLAL